MIPSVEPLNIFIGWDSREVAAWHVLANSILKYASRPVSIVPLKQSVLREAGIYTRARATVESTEFSLTRFLVPYLSGYTGRSLFMDCDMLCQSDIAKVFEYAEKDFAKICWVVKHDYTPSTSVKMDGCQQTSYPRKNWSSFILFNNAYCQMLTPEYVNTASGIALHRLEWVYDDLRIGEFPKTWNWLVGEYEGNSRADLLHYTIGGPWFPNYLTTQDESLAWLRNYRELQISTG